MLRTRTKSTLPVLGQITYEQWVPSEGVFTYYGYPYVCDCAPAVLGSSVKVDQSLGPSDQAFLTSHETIVDEENDKSKVTKDKIKYVRHTKSDISAIPFFYGAVEGSQEGVAEYATIFWPRPMRWYSKQKVSTWLPALHMLAKANDVALVKLQGDDLILDATVGSLPSDRLSEVPARMVKKLDSLHLLNTAWEARELPDLKALFDKRNRLSTRAGLDWIAAAVSDRKKLKAMLKLTPRGYASKAFLSWLSRNQLGYSFGLAPTVGEVRDIVKSLQKGDLGKRNFRTTATIIQDDEYNKTSTLEGLPVPIYSAQCREKVLIRRVDGMRATLRRRRFYSDFLENVLPALVGHNPMGMIWAAMPASWCVDLLLSIDDVLDTLWCQKQTEYELECWSSVKVLSTQEFDSSVLTNHSGNYSSAVIRTLESGPLLRKETSLYERTPRSLPTPLSSVRARVGPWMVYLTALVALGFLPRRNKK